MRIRLFVVAVVSTLVLAGCDWPTFMYNTAHTGSSPDTSISATDLSSGLTEKWQASLGPTSSANTPASPVVAKGLVYVGTQGGVLDAFKTDGGTQCDASVPKNCSPFWRSAPVLALLSTPSVNNGFVYVVGSDGTLYVYDAAGVTNCSGSTSILCTPLWTGAVPSAGISSPVVAGGKVYVGSSNGSVYAFDAAGVTGCSAGVCVAQRKFSTGGAINSSPAVTNSVLYVGNDNGKLSAFDATGNTSCNPSHVCQPLWTATTGGAIDSSPSVAGGRVFVGSDDTKLYAFDAAGTTGCTGSPKTCAPLWTATTANEVLSSPAVANNVVYIGTLAGGTAGGRLEAYDATGVTNCSGTPRTCTPLWASTNLGTASIAPVSVANGVVYMDLELGIFSFVGSVFAFDATAPAAHCSGTPKLCTPLATLDPTGDDALGTAPNVVDGFVYVAGSGLHAFAK